MSKDLTEPDIDPAIIDAGARAFVAAIHRAVGECPPPGCAVMEDAPTRYARADPGGGGRWVTIGGREGGDGKKHGGSPVFIENGRITKGAPSLAGRRIGALDEAGEVGGHRTELDREKGYRRAVWAKKARREGVKPEYLHQLAAEMLAHDAEYKRGLTVMLQDARRIARSLGSDLTTLKARAARGIDADAVRGLDDVAQSVAAMHPEFFHDDPGNPEERLFDLLLAGNPEPMSEDDAYQQAFEVLLRDKEAAGAGLGTGGGSDEPIPFARGAGVVAHDDPGGRWYSHSDLPGWAFLRAEDAEAAALQHARKTWPT